MRPRLLILTPDFPPSPGGINIMMYRLATLLDAFQVSVVTRRQPGSRAFDDGLRFDVRRSARARWGPLDQSLLNVEALRRGIKLRPDVILNGHIVTAPAAALVGRICRAPVGVYLHADEVVRWPRLASFSVHNSAAVITVSDHTRRLATARGSDPMRTHLIHPGVDLPMTRHTQRRTQPTIVTVARLEDRFKGHDLVIEALSFVTAAIPDVCWVVIGEGALRGELERRVAERGLADHVSFLGNVSDQTRDDWLSEANVFALPSRMPVGSGGEGFGIALLEASAHRLPVIAGAAAGMLDAVVHGRTGLLVDPTSPRAIADAIISLLNDPDLADRMGEAGAERARSFSWDCIAPRVQRLLLGLSDQTTNQISYGGRRRKADP